MDMPKRKESEGVFEDEQYLYEEWFTEQSDRLERLASRIYSLRQEMAWQQLVALILKKKPKLAAEIRNMGIDLQQEIRVSATHVSVLNAKIDNIVSHIYGSMRRDLTDSRKLFFDMIGEHREFEQFMGLKQQGGYEESRGDFDEIKPGEFLNVDEGYTNLIPELETLLRQQDQSPQKKMT